MSWIIDSVVDHDINVSKYKPLAGSSHIKLPKELICFKKGTNNTQNINDSECSKCLVRYLHPADHNLPRMGVAEKMFESRLFFKDIKFPVKLKILKKN